MKKSTILLIVIVLVVVSGCAYYGVKYFTEYDFSIAAFYDSLAKDKKKTEVDDGSGTTVKEAEYKANFELARWEGHEKLPFRDFLGRGMPKAMDPNDKTIRTTLTVTEDWALSEGYGMDMVATEGSQIATYRIDVSNYNPDLDLTFCFFMEFDEEIMSLVAKGVLSTSKYMSPVTLTGAEANDLLNEVKSALEIE